eukprot:gene4237-20491_t
MIPLTAASSKVRRASQLLLVVLQTTSGLATASAAACTAASFSTQPGVAFEGENINNTAVGTVEECEEFCCSTAGCIAFTFTEYYPYPTLHSCLTGKACCFAKALGHSSYKMLNCTSGTTVAPPPPRPPPPPPPSPPPPLPPHLPDGGGSCRTEADCYYGGICSAAGSVCRCDPTWTGAHCSVLHLLPARAGSGYPTNPFNPGDSLPTTKTFTWGGAVVKDYTQSDGSSSSKNTNGDISAFAARASEGGLYHGFFAQFVNNCPMTYPTWTSSTHIRHATSPNPDGPWTDAGVAVPQAAGNPVAPDGTWLLYFTNHKWMGGNVRNCSVPRPAASWGPPITCLSSIPHQNCNTGISLAYSKSLDGPWTIKYDVVTFSSTNPGSPIFKADGSMAMAYKTWGSGGRCVGIVTAAAWDDWPYNQFPLGAASKCVGAAKTLEDPSNLWRDARGNVHFLVHEEGWGSAAQLPAADRTFTQWQFNNSRVAYPYTVDQATEEPKVLLDATGLPSLLITVCKLPDALPNAAPSKDTPAGEPQYITRTTMQPINTQPKHRETFTSLLGSR